MNNFSLYVARDSGLHRLHPLTKAIYALCVLAAGLVLPGLWTGYLLVVLGVLPLAVWGRVFAAHVQAVWRVTWPFALSILLIQGLLWGHGDNLLAVGPLAIKKEGVEFALASIGRILVVMDAFILFSLSTRPDMLMISLKQAGFPSSLTYIFVTTLQIIPRFQHKATMVLDAQRSRGLETQGNLLVRSRALIPLVIPLVLGSLVDVEERAIAIEARAFNSSHKETSVIEIPDTVRQKRIRWALVLLTSGAIVASVLWRLLS